MSLSGRALYGGVAGITSCWIPSGVDVATASCCCVEYYTACAAACDTTRCVLRAKSRNNILVVDGYKIARHSYTTSQCAFAQNLRIAFEFAVFRTSVPL